MNATPTNPGEPIRFVSGADHCAGVLVLPAGPGPFPVVVMATGFGAIRAGRLDAYAERFVAAGLAALSFDYRHFGDSGGAPRQLLDIGAQLDDWRAALRFVRHHDRLDPCRVAIWGSSFGGGHVLSIGAEDHAVAAIVAQVPFTGGRSSAGGVSPLTTAQMVMKALADRRRGPNIEPLTIPIAGPPGSLAAMTAPDALPGYAALHAGTDWDNRVTARSMLDVVRYTPGATTSQITCPLLVQVAQFDSVAPALPAKRAAGRAPLGQVSTYDIGHFDIYHGDPFEAAVTEQVSFLAEHLLRAEVIPASSAPPRPLAAKAQWDLDGRTVVITGAGRGIGAALAERAVARGARVAIFERDAVAGANTAGRLGPLADFWPVDVTDADSVGHAFADVNQQWGRVDVVVANAGITAFGPTESLDPEVFRRVLDVNLVGAWLTLRAGIPLVRPRAGYLLAVSSIGAHLHSPLQSHYVASKAGLAAAVDAIRVEVRSDGIDVGAAFPNFVASDMMTESLADRAGHRLWADKTTNMLAVDTVADALIAGIERRSSRLPVPATLWPIIAVPALVQSLIDANYDDATVRESARLADPAGWTDPARSSRD